jgi:hypothetical protein
VTVVEETRQRLRATLKTPPRPVWRPPALADFARDVRVLSFDASLANVGWVLMMVRDRVIVEGYGTIRPEHQDTGYMETWQRARHLRAALLGCPLIAVNLRNPDVLKAVEAPPVGAGLHRTESSLVAGMTVWMESDRCEDVSATHVSAVLLGDPKIKRDERKPAVRKAVTSYVPEAAGRGFNEHVRDGMSVGLTRLFDLKAAA